MYEIKKAAITETPFPPPGDRVHHTGARSGSATSLSQGSLRPDAGLLAERTAAATQHQRHSESPVCLGQSRTGLLGHPWLTLVHFVRPEANTIQEKPNGP